MRSCRSKQWLFPLFLFLAFLVSKAEVFLWPQPQSVAWGNGPPVPVSSSFEIKAPQHLELQQAAKRYKRLIFKERWTPVQVSTPPEATTKNDNNLPVQSLDSLDIFVADLQVDLQHCVDESYSIIIPERGGKGNLSANTAWGALHGLQTFSQLVRHVPKSKGYKGLAIEHGVNVTDKPLFPYRGLLLDTSSNFYPVEDILRTIRGLSYNKMNVFHWHITDAYSFPLELSKEPNLAIKGSYGSKYRYSQEDVKRIIKYGRSRGVRIVPGINAPSHTASWGAAYPEIVTCRDKFWWYSNTPWSQRMSCVPAPGQLNPLLNKTYEVFKNVVDDVASLFPDSFYHAGGEQIAPSCWSDSDDIRQYYLASAGKNASSLLEKFVSTTHPYIVANQKTAVYWEFVLLDDTVNVSTGVLPKETTIVEITAENGPLKTKLITKAGYRTIVAASDFYHLECGHGDFLGNETKVDELIKQSNSSDIPSYNYGGDGGSWCAPYKTWQRIYDYDITYNLTEAEAKLVLGGEVTLFSEKSDGGVMDSYIWPRASAMAETLWSGNLDANGTLRSAEALVRLSDWRYRLVGRGIGAAPLQPLWCLKHPHECDMKMMRDN